MQVSKRKLLDTYYEVANAVSRLDVDQETRERVADAVADALEAVDAPEYGRVPFRGIARDPLCPCAGPDDDFATPCPYEREIRVAMHLRDAPDGRSAAWQATKPVVRCVSCGAARFMPGYRERVEAYRNLPNGGAA